MPYPNGFNSMPNWNTNSQFQQAPQYNYNSVQQPTYPQLPQANSVPLQGIAGRVVNRLEDVVPNETPMDGSISLFPQSDYSCIFARQWCSDGTLKTIRYVPELQKPAEPTASLEELITARFDRLENLVSNHSNAVASKKGGGKNE